MCMLFIIEELFIFYYVFPKYLIFFDGIANDILKFLFSNYLLEIS